MVAGTAQQHLRRRATPVLVFELTPVHSDALVELLDRRWNREPVGALRRHQALTIHHEFVAPRFASEYGVVFQHQTGLFWLGLVFKGQGSSKAADPATHDHQIEDFARVDRSRGNFENPVPYGMTAEHDLFRVAIRARVIAHAGVTAPRRPLPKELI